MDPDRFIQRHDNQHFNPQRFNHKQEEGTMNDILVAGVLAMQAMMVMDRANRRCRKPAGKDAGKPVAAAAGAGRTGG